MGGPGRARRFTLVIGTVNPARDHSRSQGEESHHAQEATTAAANFLDTLERSEAPQLKWIGPGRFSVGAALFRRSADKEWSLTDRVSFALMWELRMRDAFTTDHHLQQAGFVPLLTP